MSRLPLLLLLACGGGTSAPPTPETTATSQGSTRDVDVNTLASDLGAGRVPLLIDVRTPEEFASGHVPGARNIPVDQLEARLAELEDFSGGEIYLVCRSGGRSARGADALAGHGFRTVNVAGGTLAWVEAGHATE